MTGDHGSYWLGDVYSTWHGTTSTLALDADEGGICFGFPQPAKATQCMYWGGNHVLLLATRLKE